MGNFRTDTEAKKTHTHTNFKRNTKAKQMTGTGKSDHKGAPASEMRSTRWG